MEVSAGDNYGAPGNRIVLTLAARNAGQTNGRWLLTTSRVSFRELRVGMVEEERLRWVADLRSPGAFENIQTYNGLAVPFELGPGETQRFVIEFVGAYSSILPLKIENETTFFVEQKNKVALVMGSAVGMFMLIVTCVILFGLSRRWNFFWLGTAELAHTAFVLQVTGYLSFYYLYDKGEWLFNAAYLLACVYCAASIQFARTLLRSPQTSPRLDSVFRFGIGLALSVAALQISITALEIVELRSPITIASSLVFAATSLGLPLVAVAAIRREGWRYAPLLPAWTATGGFVFYGFAASQGLLSQATFNWQYYSPVGLFSAICLTLTSVLHVRTLVREKHRAERSLSLTENEKDQWIERASALQLSRATAMATIDDQNRLLHASGHDSRQVLLALKSIVHYIRDHNEIRLPSEVSQVLEASAEQLRDVIDTTMAGGIASAEVSGPIVLSRVELGEVLQQVGAIYRSLAHKKGLKTQLATTNSLSLITDRAFLARILSNLLENAVKFSHRGMISLTVEAESNAIRIVICDEGVGMDENLVARLVDDSMEPVQGNKSVEGTGFGFKASMSLLNRLGGQVEIRSEFGAGTRVCLSLPFAIDRKAPSVNELHRRVGGILTRGVDLCNGHAPSSMNDRTDDFIVPIISDRRALQAPQWNDISIAVMRPLYEAMLDHPAMLDATKRVCASPA